MAVVAVDGGDELRSVAACEKQRRGEGARRVRESQGLRGAAGDIQGEEEAARQGGAGSRRWPRVRAQATRLCLLARGGRGPERGGRSEGTRGVVVASLGGPGKQEVARGSAHGRQAAACLLWREEAGGWHGPA